MVNSTRLHLNRAAPRRVCLLICGPCSAPVIPVEENGAVPGSVSATPDIYQAGLHHICLEVQKDNQSTTFIQCFSNPNPHSQQLGVLFNDTDQCMTHSAS